MTERDLVFTVLGFLLGAGLILLWQAADRREMF